MKVFYTYKHIRLDRDDSEKPFYVGKGTDYRAWSESSRTRNRHWHNVANCIGYRVEIIEVVSTNKEALDREEYWISHYKNLGYCECNYTMGGEGALGTPESKLHNSIAQKKYRKEHPEYNPMKLPESKLKLSILKGGKLFQVFNRHTGELVGEWINQRDCCRSLGLGRKMIYKCLKGICKYYRNYIFKYKESKCI